MTTPTETTAAVDLVERLAAAFHASAADADVQGAMPTTDVEQLRGSGYLRLALPTEAGGAATDLRTHVAAQIVLASGSASSALVAAMTASLVGYARDAPGWSAERERLFEIVRRGGLVNTVASEPALGSPARGGLPTTRLTPSGGRYRLDGRKTWATGGRHLTHLIVFARLEDAPVSVLVPNHAEGLTWHDTWGRGLALRASESHDVAFEAVTVDPGQVLSLAPAPPDEKPNPWFVALVAATYLGAARAARDAVVGFALERVPSGLGVPIATLPAVRRQLGEIEVAYAPAVAALLEAASAWDERREALPLALAKHVAVEAALRVTETALRIAGGAGLSRALPLERYFRDARGGFGHPPSGDALLERLGDAAIASFKHGGSPIPHGTPRRVS